MRSGEDEEGAGDDDKSGDKGGREMAGGKSTGASAGIGGVDGGIGEAIEGHGGGTGSEHGDDDPEKLMDSGKAGGGEHGSAEREGESEDRMLPLDHLESDAEIVEDGHRKIVRQLSVLGPQNAEWKDDWASEDALPYGSARASLCEKLASIPKVRS